MQRSAERRVECQQSFSVGNSVAPTEPRTSLLQAPATAGAESPNSHLTEQSLQPSIDNYPRTPKNIYTGVFLVKPKSKPVLYSQKERGEGTTIKVKAAILSSSPGVFKFFLLSKSSGAPWCASVISAPGIWRQGDQAGEATLPK